MFFTKRPGVVTTVTVLAITGVVTLAFLTLSTLAASQFRQTTAVAESEQTFFAAEGGINQGIYRLTTNPAPQNFTQTINQAAVEIAIQVPLPGDPCYDALQKSRKIISTANLRGLKRTLQVCVATDALAGNLQYAVQSGPGGVILEENSEVHGNLYANGPISGTATKKGYVFGHTWTAGSHLVSGITVGTDKQPKDLHAASYNNVKVFGSIDSTNQPTTSYPFTSEQIAEWKDAADDTLVDGGGHVTINGDRSLSGKITGNLTINKGIVTLTGPVWVTGNISIKPTNQITIRLPGSGDASGIIIAGDVPDVDPYCDTADGLIDVGNNAVIRGSDSPKSFTLLVSTKKDVADPVIFGGNSSTSVIYFAPCGKIRINNTAELNNTTGHTIQLQQKAKVYYNPNLTGFHIPGGLPGPILPSPGTWQEL